MRKQTVMWFGQFLDDYHRYTLPDFRASETEIIERFSELEHGTDFFIISISEEITIDGQGRMFRFSLVSDDQQEIMKYDGWVDV